MKTFVLKPPQDLVVGVAWPGKRLQLEMRSDSTVLQVKQQVMELAQVPPEVQMLTYQGKILKDHKTLRDYKVKNDRTLLMTRLGVDLTHIPEYKPRRQSVTNLDGHPTDTTTTTNPTPSIKHLNSITPTDAISLPAESGRYHEDGDGATGEVRKIASSYRHPDGGGLVNSDVTVANINRFLDDWFETKGTPRAMKDQKEPQDIVMTTPDITSFRKEEAAPEEPPAEEVEPPKPAPQPVQMDVMAAFMEEEAAAAAAKDQAFMAPTEFIDKEQDDEIIKFVVRYGKKDHKLKMNANQDLWAVKLKLEAAKVGRAGQMVLYDADEEELDEDGTLDENDVIDGSKLIVKLKS